MKKYYLHDGKESQGPFDLSELKSKGINRNTPVWYEGLPDWTTAERIAELRELFSSATPPPIQSVHPASGRNVGSGQGPANAPIKKKSNLLLIVIGSVGVVAAVLVVLFILSKISIGGGGASSYIDPAYTEPQTYQEKVMSVEEIERAQPTQFLEADGTYQENFWGDKFRVNCSITNKATVATYKDVIVRVTYYTKTKTVLGSNDYTIYEIFPPTSKKTVLLKIDNYKDVNSIGLEVVDAVAY